MPEVGAELERAVTEFRGLNRRRLFGVPPLDVAELERWSELREALEATFDGTGASAGSRREHLRMPTHLRVEFHSGRALREALLTNISEGGLFIAIGRPLEVGTPLQLRIHAELLPPLAIAARVVWSRTDGDDEPPGMGVRFEGVADDVRRHLDRVLQRVAEDL